MEKASQGMAYSAFKKPPSLDGHVEESVSQVVGSVGISELLVKGRCYDLFQIDRGLRLATLKLGLLWTIKWIVMLVFRI